MIQCARIAFGFTGIYDQDEAERIAEAGNGTAAPQFKSENDLPNLDEHIAAALLTKTDQDALQYWKDNNKAFAQYPDLYKQFKEAVTDHRLALKEASATDVQFNESPVNESTTAPGDQ